MEQLRQQVRRAHVRLVLGRLLSALGYGVTTATAVALAVILVDKFWPLGIDSRIVLGAGVATGVVGGIAWTLWKRRGMLDSAVELDRRFGLKERVSSTLSLSDEELQTGPGQALLNDAIRRAERIHVSEKFGIQLSRWSLVPVATFAAALAILLFMPSFHQSQRALAKTDAASLQKKKIQTSTEALRRRLEERRKEAEKQGLDEAEKLLQKVELGTRDLQNRPVQDRKQALVKLNNLATDLAERRNQLEGADQLRKQLAGMKELTGGPADKFAKALKQGDFSKAMEMVKQLQDQIAAGELNKEQTEKLAQQLNDLKQKLDRMAEMHEQMKRDLEAQIQQKMQEGKRAEAEALKRQLEQLKQQDAQMDRMASMSKKLGACAECMNQGDAAGAKAQMAELAGQLSELESELAEMEMLDSALDEISMAKDSMMCPGCNGEGCEMCSGLQGRLAGMGMGRGQGRGNGMGEGAGEGDRPEERGDTNTYNSRVKQKHGQGAAVLVDMVEGPNRRGDVLQDIRSEFESSAIDEADPLTEQRLPRSYREHAREFFRALRDGESPSSSE